MQKKEPEVIEGNILDRELVSQIFKSNKNISSVIHFAALKAVGESTIDPLKYYENNVGGSIVLLQEMIKAGVFNLVLVHPVQFMENQRNYPLMNLIQLDRFPVLMEELNLLWKV